MGLQSLPDARVFTRHSGESKMTQVAARTEQLKKASEGQTRSLPLALVDELTDSLRQAP